MSVAQLHGQCSAPSVGALNSLVTTLVQALFTAQCAISSEDIWPPDYGDFALKQDLEEYDFVVVGAGSAGSVIASRLSENPDWKVLVLEAGDNPPQESEVPTLSSTISHTKFTWQYWTQPDGKTCLAQTNQSCAIPRGKMIGGTGAMNGMVYIRGNRKDYDGWLEQGNHGWSWHDVLPYFEKAVRPVGNATHPQGYLILNHFDPGDIFLQHMLFDGARELGIPHVEDFIEGSEIGITSPIGTVKDGRRMSTGKVHLAKVAKRPNLHVIKNAQVTRINFDKSGQHVRSVTFIMRDKYVRTVRIAKELVLSAGTIDSAKLLMLSGVGPANHLSHLHIPVVHDLNVGRNLQDHALTEIFFEIDAGTAAKITEKELLDNTYYYLIHSRDHSALATAFVNSEEGSASPYPDIEYNFMLFRRGDHNGLSVLLKSNGVSDAFSKLILKRLDVAHILVCFTFLAHPKSRGKIRLRSENYMDKPKITPNYLTHAHDVETMLRGIKLLVKAEKTSAFRRKNAVVAHIPIEECDEYDFKSDSYWRCYIKYFTRSGFHITGTVKMGPESDETACVDPHLLVRGVMNMRVADASIMPNVPSANTNAATIMIGERAADFIKERWLA